MVRPNTLIRCIVYTEWLTNKINKSKPYIRTLFPALMITLRLIQKIRLILSTQSQLVNFPAIAILGISL